MFCCWWFDANGNSVGITVPVPVPVLPMSRWQYSDRHYGLGTALYACHADLADPLPRINSRGRNA